MVFVATFGLFHGIAHGLEVPAAANPILFILGFIFGTATLHLLGVVIGHLSIKNNISLILFVSLNLLSVEASLPVGN